MKNGVTVRIDPRDAQYQFHHHYGALRVNDLPDDFGWGSDEQPDQEADNAPTECTGYAQTDNETDVTGILYSPDFSYAAGIEAEGVAPNTGGCDFRASLQGVINRGVLPRDAASLSAKELGELYVANMNNWLTLARLALVQTESSYRWVKNGPHDYFDNLRSALYLAKKGISVASRFYGTQSTDGVAVAPDFLRDGFSYHNWNIKKSTTRYLAGEKKGQLIRSGEVFLAAKTWQGTGVGNQGWLYYDRAYINAWAAQSDFLAAVLTKDGNRLWSILIWLAQKFPALVFYLPRLFTVVNGAV